MARTNAAFVLIIALLLISINLQLDNFKLFSSSPLSISLSAEKYRLLSTEEKRDHLDQAEQTQFRNKHSENSNQKKNEGRTRNDSDQRHLYRWKNPTTGLQYKKRWIHRFRQATRRNNLGGIFFFRHIRKAGGTSLRLYFQQVMEHHKQVFAAAWPYTDGKIETLDHLLGKDNPKILYVEEEFRPMSYDCPATDPRWRDTLSVTVLRHPIERHMSEFFYHGPGKALMPLNRTRLYVDEEYTEKISNFLMEEVPRWIRRTDNARSNHYNEEEEESLENFRLPFFSRHYTDNLQLRAFAGCSDEEYTEKISNFLMEEVPRWIRRTDNARSNHNHGKQEVREKEEESSEDDYFRRPFFSRHYTDNLQLRAFAGCSTRECIEQTSMKNEVTEDEISFIEEKRKIKIDSYSSPNWRCAGDENPIGYCISDHEVCPNGCEGPCKFPSISFGKLTKDDLERGEKSLEAFDVVLITETFDDATQREFLADVLSAPREFGIGNDNSFLSHDYGTDNGGGVWNSARNHDKQETNTFYRTLLRNLAIDAYDVLVDENELELEFYRYAVELNKMQVEQWKSEVRWEE
eukprot:CAMPEP_0171354180 /NCGR_PEP_ID=MMETSP0878-20121228/44574_1 /TAXON_ID=67004 /ORGANISM="Thalassiosira weissflogii, Strain CCMP1336" /LENGTH=574 /DNA_ID=CAMNT_0011860145 /DNA_START=195 /DNA_END=1919 /DNA_ORIENTATION=-